MFNIHSTELLVICIVALIVIGPEKLPAAIKTASLWIGRFRRSFYKVKAEIERELNTDEIRRQLHNESVLADIEAAKSNVKKTAQEAEESVNRIVNSDNFDPGASKYSTDEAGNTEEQSSTKTVKQEADPPPKQPGKPVYGSGKNPKLASNESTSEEKNIEDDR